MYKLEYTETAKKQLSKLDKYVARTIVGWMSKNVDNSENPRDHGKPLVSNLRGKWRYRVGDYRVICEIQDNKLLVLAISIGHRRDIYL